MLSLPVAPISIALAATSISIGGGPFRFNDVNDFGRSMHFGDDQPAARFRSGAREERKHDAQHGVVPLWGGPARRLVQSSQPPSHGARGKVAMAAADTATP